jgi:hypothetical protein
LKLPAAGEFNAPASRRTNSKTIEALAVVSIHAGCRGSGVFFDCQD